MYRFDVWEVQHWMKIDVMKMTERGAVDEISENARGRAKILLNNYTNDNIA